MFRLVRASCGVWWWRLCDPWHPSMRVRARAAPSPHCSICLPSRTYWYSSLTICFTVSLRRKRAREQHVACRGFGFAAIQWRLNWLAFVHLPYPMTSAWADHASGVCAMNFTLWRVACETRGRELYTPAPPPTSEFPPSPPALMASPARQKSMRA